MVPPSNLQKHLAKLVAYPTVTQDTASSEACLNYVADWVQARGLHISKSVSHGFTSLVATTRPTSHPKLLLQAHLDVVPAAQPELFQLQDRGDKLYGRGVYDMKFAVACYLQLIEDLAADLALYDFGIMLTSDEEIGGQNGVKYLLEQGYRADVCLIPDGGNDWKIEASCNGIWMIRLSATGKAAHGSRPWEGDNAINKLLACIAEIHELFGNMTADRNTMVLSQIKGGAAINQVPGQAEATIDMRFINRQAYETQRQQIEKIIKQYGLTVETLAEVNVVNTDLKNPQVRQFIEVAERVRGKPLESCHSLGATDAQHFVPTGIPTIVIRPSGGGHHGDEEWIDKRELLEFYAVLKTYVTEVARRDA